MSEFQHVVISGVSRGMGRALFSWFAEQGLRVSGCASSVPDTLPQTELTRFDQVDIRSRMAVERWARDVVDSQGVPDLLINNASVGMDHGPFHTLDLKAIEDLLNINYAGTIRVTHAFVGPMVERGGGVVATMSTPPKGIPSKEIVPYATSKYGTVGFTEALAGEKLRGMSFVNVFPGILNTALTRNSYGKKAERFPTPEEWIEKAGPFFAGLNAEHNGQHLSI